MAVSPFSMADVERSLGGRYVLSHELRTGGQGVVYRAKRIRDTKAASCNNDVALKVHLDPKQDARVQREIQAAQNLKHPTLATLLEEGIITIGGQPTRFIAWDFIEGEPLDKVITKGRLNEGAATTIGFDVAVAIGVLWSKHIVHRDVAPKNIMVKPDGRAVLIDLGGARHLDRSTLTAPGYFFGTIGYLSPEQFRAEHALTCASDIFALGIVMFECLLGHHPTFGDQHQLVSTPPLATVQLPTAKTLAPIIDRMLLARAPFRPSLHQLIDDLKKLIVG